MYIVMRLSVLVGFSVAENFKVQELLFSRNDCHLFGYTMLVTVVDLSKNDGQ